MPFLRYLILVVNVLFMTIAMGQTTDSLSRGNSKGYGTIAVGVSGAYSENSTGDYKNSFYPMLYLSIGYNQSINKDVSIGIQAPFSFFVLNGFNNIASQFGGFALVNFGNCASRENKSALGFFLGPGILSHYADITHYDVDPPPPPMRITGLAYQAGLRFGLKEDRKAGISVQFIYGTDFHVSGKKLYDVKIAVSGIFD
ncbi:hypothetical protein [Flavihumibacter profundi]|jgi:hypothetical protein|uniref:hypothetical protein n=1 Tax=Flavihumibacter profundi TaxID=2716883 RepID=UPI001CC60677|nr:hypothetical protein [Flavihumibacter profundi]MBZ5856452.1 hypothetical protein [Flavihumibacter profundi]